MNYKRLFSLFLLALLAACSSGGNVGSTNESYESSRGTPYNNNVPYSGHYKIGAPYKIENKWYYPKKDEAYDEEGMASWYGPGFHGRKTANGDSYDQQSLTAAHRTLPLPSVVRITNLENGRSVVAMVNDRGPFSRSRIIDVSERVADLIGMKQKGTGKVRVQYLPQQTNQLLEKLALSGKAKNMLEKRQVAVADPPPPTVATKPIKVTTYHYQDNNDHFMKSVREVYIQSGAYSQKENADHIAAKLAKFGKVTITPVTIDTGTLYRVRLGPIRQNANSLLTKIIKAGNSNAIIVGNNG